MTEPVVAPFKVVAVVVVEVFKFTVPLTVRMPSV